MSSLPTPGIRAWLISRLALTCALAPESIDVRERFTHYGLDSLSAIRLMAALSEHLGRPLSPTLVWEHPSPDALASYLEGDSTASSPARKPTQEYGAEEPIAIVGMACRFPGAPDVPSFWRLLRDGVDAVSEVPEARGWGPLLSARGVTPEERAMVRRGAFLERIDGFEPLFFGISPREAASIDPQQRLMLELCWEALEDAGIRPGSLKGSRTGVFAGAIWSDQQILLYRGGPGSLSQYTCSGGQHSIIANRISYVLGLEGPSMTLDSACSSGLVAVHLASDSLRRGESEVAIAGAVNLNMLPESALAVSRFGALSPDGRCYSFDARANGYVRGEGAGVVVLKTLSRAIADGDPIYALIRGSAVNNDGASNGLTAPSRAAQESVLREAYRRAGVRPDEVHYVEAHGTGTPLGDPIEARALGAVLGAGAGRPADAPLFIGSAKTNLGHLEGAAGIVGLMKTALALKHRLLPPSLNFASPNPHAPLAELGLSVPTAALPFPAPDRPLTAGVSSFGFGGTNSHVVLQEWPAARLALARPQAPSTSDAAATPSAGAEGAPGGVVFVFPGQGAQWHGMARSLLQSEPVVRAVLQDCDRYIRRYAGFSLIAELTASREASRLDAIEVSLPTIIATDIALATFWRKVGVEPAAVVGHSTGEIAAAHVAGALDLDDTMRIICAYGRFVGRFAGRSGMAFVGLPWDEAPSALAGFEGRVFRAIQDSAEGTVVAGEPGALAALLASLEARGVFCRAVNMNVGPHSPLVDAVRGELFEALRGIRPRRARVPLISEVTGAEVDGEALDAAHWVRNFGDPAFFSRAVDALIGRGHRVFLDVGPHPLTKHSIETNLRRAGCGPESAKGGVVLASMRRGEEGHGALIESLAALAARGVPVLWDELDPRGDDAVAESADAWLLPLSARSAEALVAQASAYAEAVRPSAIPARLQDITYTASVRREHHPHRLAVVGRSRQELSLQLEAFARGEAASGAAEGQASPAGPPKLVFVFPGQGSQWVGMGRELFQAEPVFREAMERCDAAIRPLVSWSLLATINGGDGGAPLDRIDVIQPALFAMQVSLAALWRSWGIACDAVVGHSMGEIAAAHVAGALSLDDAAAIICRRSLLLRRVSGKGAMALVELSLEQAEEAIAGFASRVAVGVSNSPRSTVLSGERAALEEILAPLERRGVLCRWVKVNVASHSPQMDPLLGELAESLAGIAPRAASVPIYSTVTGAPSDGASFDAAYWVRNLREPVLFSTAVQALLKSEHEVFVEVSPHPVLVPPMEEGFRHAGRRGLALASLRSESPERATLLTSLGALYTRGYPVAFESLYPRGGRLVRVPTYPWQREPFNLELPDRPVADPSPVVSSLHGAASRHPLLGPHFQPAISPGTHLWEAHLSAASPPSLGDHRVQGRAIFPASAYLEIALSAAAEAFGPGPHTLGRIDFAEALYLPEQGHVTVQTVVSPEVPGLASFKVLSLAPKGDSAEPSSWVQHASGRIRLRGAAPVAEGDRRSMEAIRARCGALVSGEEHYRSMKERGLEYGPAFQGVERLWRSEDGEAIGRLQPSVIAASRAPYEVHPALLDSAFQILAAALPRRGAGSSEGSTYLPVALDALRIDGPLGEAVYCHARLGAGGEARTGMFEGDLALLDEQGRVLVEARGLRVQRVGESSARSPVEAYQDWLYAIAWRPKELAKDTSARTPQGRWLIFADAHGVGRALADRLETRGEPCVLVVPDKQGAPREAGIRRVASAGAEGFHRLLSDVFREGEAPCRGVVYLWALDVPTEPASLDALRASQELTSTAVVHLLQAVARAGFRDAPRLWLVTRGAQAVAGETGPVAIAQAPLWGLGATIVYEHPELRCACVDLAAEPAPGALAALADELVADGEEDRIALRHGGRYVARLTRVAPGAALSPETPAAAPAGDRPFHLTIARPGTLDSLELREAKRTPPGRGEIEIQVRAAGLNFLDVLLALCVIPEDTPDPALQALCLGSECAGTISAVGDGVEGFRVGQDVIAIGRGSIGAFVTTSSLLAAPRPAHLSFEQAASIPVAFLTAFYALHHVGRLAPGERVLIHAATGGVGLAAVQLARRAGAEIFATAGSPEKREMLRGLGVKHVMDSRSLDFAAQVLEQTGGEGVDLVLNSLSGSFIPESFALLRDHGRFVELGKRDYYEDRKLGLRPFLKNLSYSLVDLRAMFQKRPAMVQRLLGEVMQLFETKELAPVPHRAFPVAEVRDAFHRMAKAEHTGKIIISLEGKETALIEPSARAPASLRADATYLITGGLGGLGLELARWLVAGGARHLVLVSRSGPSPAAEEALAALRRDGAEVQVERADIAEVAQIAEVFRRIDRSMPRLAGIFHAAAVLEDATLLRQSAERLRAVAAPKVDGAWNLSALCAGRSLDFFVFYSSVASVLGSPGQANYCAANAFLDALAHHLHRKGVPAVSINWGAWTEVGLAAAAESRGDRLATRGLAGMAPSQALAALGEVLRSAPAQIAVMPFDVRQWGQFHPKAAESPLFTELAAEIRGSGARRGGGEVRAALLGAAIADRRPLLEAHLREQSAKVLRVPSSRVERRTPLRSLGFDSLMAIELRNRLEASLGLTLPATLVWGYPTVAELAPELSSRMQIPLEAPPANAQAPAPDAAAEEAEGGWGYDDVDALSREALIAELAGELAEIEREKTQ